MHGAAFLECKLSNFLLDIKSRFHNMARVPHSKTIRSPYRVQVLDRALAALAVLAESSSDCSLAELCPALGLHKSTAHRLMMVLEQHRLVVKSPETGRYKLGLRLYELGSRACHGLDCVGAPGRHPHRLQERFGETVFFCILDEGQVFSRWRRWSCSAACAQRAPWEAARRPIAQRLAKPCCRSFPKTEFPANRRPNWGLKAITAKTITTIARFKSELKAVRERGYAIDDEEKEDGLRCVGAVVRAHSRKLSAAMSISGPAFRMTRERIPEVGAALMQAASELSAELGYPGLPIGTLRRAAS